MMKTLLKMQSFPPKTTHSNLKLFSLIMVVSLFSFFILCTVPTGQQALASEVVPQEAAAKARKLQLEGTKLQLKGDLKQAVEKYNASINLKPNPGLEKLVGTLERMISKKEQATTADAAPPEDTASPEDATSPTVPQEQIASPVPPPVVAETEETPGPSDQAVSVVERAPGTPDEELIFAFTDWFIDLFPEMGEQLGFGLKTNRNYSIAPDNGNYKVNLDKFVFYFDETNIFKLSPLSLSFQPQGQEKLAFQIGLPEKSFFESDGEIVVELHIPSQMISGVWDRTTQYIETSAIKLGDISIKTLDGPTLFNIKQFNLNSLYLRNEDETWREKYTGNLVGISLADSGDTITIGDIAIQYVLDGLHARKYEEIRKSFYNFVANFEEMDLPDVQQLCHNVDEYIQLLKFYNLQFLVQNIAVQTGDQTKIDSFSFTANLKKDDQKNTFFVTSETKAKGIAFNGKQTEGNMLPMSFVLDEIVYTDAADISGPPTTLFSDLFTSLEEIDSAKREKSDEEFASQGLGFTKLLLRLLKKYSMNFGISGLAVKNALPDQVNLDSMKIGGGFDIGAGEGGKIHGLLSFSGFNMVESEDEIFPHAATINFALDKIPSLLDLVSDPSSIAQGDIQQVQGMVMLNAMNTFMMSPLVFSLNDSFVAFANSKFNLNLALTMNSQAKNFSTGTMQIVIEDPDNLMKIVQSLGADEGTQQMLATITALADRTSENGKTIDRLDGRMDQEGKIFINTKDVTLMFFPEKPQESPESSEGPESSESPETETNQSDSPEKQE